MRDRDKREKIAVGRSFPAERLGRLDVRMLCGKAGFAPVEGDVALACLVVKGGRREAGGLGPGRRQASQGSRGAATPLCCQRRPGALHARTDHYVPYGMWFFSVLQLVITGGFKSSWQNWGS